jgi:P pilus assembly chaperone PapD
MVLRQAFGRSRGNRATEEDQLYKRAAQFAALAALVALSSAQALAQPQPPASAPTAPTGADLSISPKRIVLKPTDRAATIYIFNRGSEAATFALKMGDAVMTPDGQIRTAADLAEAPEAAPAAARLQSATSLVSFSPRRVTLLPGQSQTIRLRALRPEGLADGEYRTHLTITAVPPEDVGFTADQAAKANEGQLSVKIVTLFSVSMPIIVRQGAPEVTAAIGEVRVTPRATAETSAGRPVADLSLDLMRQGKNSLYGDIEVRAMKAGKAGEVIGAARGLGVYAEIDQRRVMVPLMARPTHGEVLQVQFRDDDTRPGTLLATVNYTAP